MPSHLHNTTPVVIFRSETYCALGMTRSLGRMGVPVHCVDHEPRAAAFRSRYCTERHFWNFETASEEESVGFLVELAKRIGGKPVLLPTFDARNLFVDRYRSELSKHYLLPMPTPGAMERLYSKKGLHSICVATGTPSAATIFPVSLADAMDGAKSLRFPLVAKGIDGDRLTKWCGRRLAIVPDYSSLEAIYRELDEPGAENLLLQEFIPPSPTVNGFVAAYFGQDGQCHFALTGHKLRQLPLDGGVTTLGETADCSAIKKHIERVILEAGYRGIVGADFCFDSHAGNWKLLDVNPRAGANFRLFVDGNSLDVVRCLYLDLTGQNIPKVEPAWGRKFMVEDKDLVAAIKSIARKRLNPLTWIRSFFDVDEFAYFSPDDMKPSVGVLRDFVGSMSAAALRKLTKR